MREIVIRQALPTEIGTIRELRYRVLDAMHGVDERQKVSEKDIANDSILIGAFIGEKAVGTVRLEPLEKEKYLVRRMAIDPEMQGNGLGARVLEVAEGIAAQRGAKEFVLESRLTAIGFYEKQGYTLTSKFVVRDGDRNDEMTKSI